MSFIDDIADFASSTKSFITGNGIGSTLARTALAGLALSQIAKSINKDNEKKDTPTDYSIRNQSAPNTNNSIPVVYGTAILGGKVTDAVLTNSNQTMWFCLTICEKTGTLMSTGANSQISFEAVYWNQLKVNFQSDGITVASFSDEDGNVVTDPDGLIKIYPFSGNSTSPINFSGYSSGNGYYAYNLFPDWTTSHTMSDLVFALVRVDYNKTKNVTELGDIQFKVKNTIVQPGDCLYDYMTNTRYGAGIASGEINQ